MRPLGIPSFRDKLLQEAIRRILEAIYEPIFHGNSHGFRPHRSCHTCIKQIKRDFTGTVWFIEGDIKACFDSINHKVLIEILQRKIKDTRLINLIRQFLKAGYVEDYTYNSSYNGTPQGGILSPILANIYLNELDKKVDDIKEKFDESRSAKLTETYREKGNEIKRLSRQIDNEKDEQKRKELFAVLTKRKQDLRKIPCSPQDNKRLVYARYADDWLIGICGNKKDCEVIKKEIGSYLKNTLKLELSEEKTLITHSSKRTRFLGYDISVRRSQVVKRTKKGIKKRTMNHQVQLSIPLEEKIKKFLFTKGVVVQTDNGDLKPVHRPSLLRLSDREIVERYNAEIRGTCNYYHLASNYHKLNYFCYLMEYSCLKTFAMKFKTSISEIKSKYRHENTWSIPYMTKNGLNHVHIAKTSDCKNGIFYNTTLPSNQNTSRTTIYARLQARYCELCTDRNAETYEIHHVGSLKKLGDSVWEKVMKKKRRKTLVVCRKCHTHVIHG